MTVILAYHLPGKGAVLAADGRVTAGTEILTDRCDKTMRCGSVTLAVSGHDGALVGALHAAKDLQSVVNASGEYAKARPEQNWSLVMYDAARDLLLSLDSDGYLQETERHFLGGGCGGTYALGYAESRPLPRSLGTAAALCRETIRATFRRDSACGGRIRVLTCPRA